MNQRLMGFAYLNTYIHTNLYICIYYIQKGSYLNGLDVECEKNKNNKQNILRNSVISTEKWFLFKLLSGILY